MGCELRRKGSGKETEKYAIKLEATKDFTESAIVPSLI